MSQPKHGGRSSFNLNIIAGCFENHRKVIHVSRFFITSAPLRYLPSRIPPYLPSLTFPLAFTISLFQLFSSSLMRWTAPQDSESIECVACMLWVVTLLWSCYFQLITYACFEGFARWQGWESVVAWKPINWSGSEGKLYQTHQNITKISCLLRKTAKCRNYTHTHTHTYAHTHTHTHTG